MSPGSVWEIFSQLDFTMISKIEVLFYNEPSKLAGRIFVQLFVEFQTFWKRRIKMPGFFKFLSFMIVFKFYSLFSGIAVCVEINGNFAEEFMEF